MTDARPQLNSAPSVSRMLALTAAALLIFAGVVFQLGEFLCRRIGSDGYWLIHMIATNLWNMLVLRLNMPDIGDVLRFWPLILVGFGFAILLALQSQNQPARQRSRRSDIR